MNCFSRIVFLTIEDGGVLHRSSDACPPILRICTVQAFRPVSERQFQHTTEGTLLSVHSVRTTGRDDLVGPPARSHLRRESVLAPFLGLELRRNVICERIFCAAVVREARTQHLPTDALAVHIQFVHAETCGHPQSLHHAFLIC